MREAPDPYLPGHGDLRYAVEHYDLRLDYRPATNRLDARATLAVRALQATDTLRLDLSGLTVDRVLVGGSRPRKVTRKERAVVVKLAGALDAGATTSLEVAYSGKPTPVPGPHGPAGWEELTDGVLVASQPYGAPSWYPCNDRADDKATYRLEVTTDAAYTVVATGRRTGAVTRAGRTTWTFAESEPTAPYLVTLALGHLTEEPLTGAGGRVTVVRPSATPVPGDSPLAKLPAMMTALEEWFGPYPFAAFRAVVVDDALEIPLEAQAMASFGTNHVTAGWDNERLVVHELAHQWFGNAVTSRLLRDIWLHEGFACYSEWLWSERCGQDTADQWAARHWSTLAGGVQPAPLGDPGMDHMFDDWVYKRGALTVHALRAALGETAFFAVCEAWVSTHAGGVVETDDLVTLATRHAGTDLAPLFSAWLEDTSLPPCPRTGGPTTLR